jgi:ABC-type proline/glycine betaine transport system permease subunit
MTLVILVNAGILIAYTFTSSEDTTDLLDEIDGYLVYVYLAEVIIKLFGMGVINYFSDGWNMYNI